MKKILIITNTSAHGGAENFLYNLIHNIDINKFTVTFAFLKSEKIKNETNFIDLGLKYKYDLSPIWNIKKIINDYDLVHCNLFQAEIYTLLAARLADFKGKIISTIHNTEELYRNKLLMFFYKRFFLQKADQFIAISQAVRDYFIRYTNCPANKIRVIYYGLAEKHNLKRRVASKVSKIALIGRYAPQKGHKYLIAAMPEIIKRKPAIQFMFIGRDEKKMKNKFIKQAKKLGVLKFIKFIDFKADLTEIYSSISALVLPSLWEGFGLVLLEAMLSRVPIVSTKVGPIPEIIKNNYSGILVNPKDPVALTNAILKILESSRLQKIFTNNGYRIAKQKFSLKTMVKKYEELYNRLTS